MKFHKPAWLISITVLGAVLLSSCNLGAEAVPTEDAGAIQTQAFNIVLTQAALQLTQTALANPPTAVPTNTLMPTATLGVPTFAPIGGGAGTPFAAPTIPGLTPLASPVPTLNGLAPTLTTQSGCNNGLYLSETSPNDGAQMKPGEVFSKGWKIQNTGTCPWDEGYAFMLNKIYTTDIQNVTGESLNISILKPEDIIQPGASQLFIVKLKTPATPGNYKWCWKLQDDKGEAFGPLVCTLFVVVNQ